MLIIITVNCNPSGITDYYERNIKTVIIELMAKSIDVEIRASGYENVYYDCPKCGKENILNRVSDLEGNVPIARLEGLVCENTKCRQIINIVSDRVVAAKYRWFFDELYILVARKEYRAYALTLCQGMEAFFYQAVVNKMLDREKAYRDDEGSLDLTSYNQARANYEKRIERYTFADMRHEFLKVYETERLKYTPLGLRLRKDERKVSFDTVANTDIHTLRNAVVHKQAYRPAWHEIESYGELVSAVYWLGMYLDVKDSMLLLNKRL